MLLIFAAVYQFFDAMYIVYNGALRGAGDTLVPAVMTGVLCWGITVFGGYAVARRWTRSAPPGRGSPRPRTASSSASSCSPASAAAAGGASGWKSPGPPIQYAASM